MVVCENPAVSGMLRPHTFVVYILINKECPGELRETQLVNTSKYSFPKAREQEQEHPGKRCQNQQLRD